jgi:hypothetical protein
MSLNSRYTIGGLLTFTTKFVEPLSLIYAGAAMHQHPRHALGALVVAGFSSYWNRYAENVALRRESNEIIQNYVCKADLNKLLKDYVKKPHQ